MPYVGDWNWVLLRKGRTVDPEHYTGFPRCWVPSQKGAVWVGLWSQTELWTTWDSELWLL